MSEFKFKPAKGSLKNRKRRGRGNASGLGGESGRGHKGQRSRSGFSSRPGFEGGQTPLYRRIPKKRGQFNPFRIEYQVVNLNRLSENFKDGEEINTDKLVEKGLVRKGCLVKVLGDGDLDKKLTFVVDAVSKAAKEAIEKSGGSVTLK